MRNRLWIIWIVFIMGACLWGIQGGHIVFGSSTISHRSTFRKPSKSQTVFVLSGVQHLSGEVFASPKESFDRRKQIIMTATGSLDMWMYDITFNRAKLPLVQLADAGLPIRVLLEDNKYSSFGNSFVATKMLFEDAGMQVVSDSDVGLKTNFIHAKTFVTPHWALIQTANLTNGGFNTSREYYVHTTDTGFVSSIQNLFAADRKGKQLTGGQLHSNLLVCPINCRAIIQGLIASAHTSIYVQNQYVEDPVLTKLLAQRSGLDMKVILAQNEYAQPLYDVLGDKVRFLTSPYPHAKIMLIDDRYLLISSINFSTNSMDSNREIGVIITNADAIAYVKHRFFLDWGKAKLQPKLSSGINEL